MASDGDQCAAERTAGRGGLRILHVMRAPVGGLFRHVVDLTRAQAKAGHEVGIVADSTTGGDAAEGIFAQLRPSLALGLERLPMRRLPHPDDLRVAWRVASLLRRCEPDVLHGHGAKGGALHAPASPAARLSAAEKAARARLYAAWREPAFSA